MNKCPRCKLPHKGTHRCQYCGYDLSKNKKPFKTIRNKLEDIIGTLSNNQTLANKKAKITDHGGTRTGSDRRKYLNMHYSPERRSGKDRRKRVDRKGQAARNRL
jgi:uncharacterized Zn finger protein (UPF0148 family)